MFPEKQARSEFPCGRDHYPAHKEGLAGSAQGSAQLSDCRRCLSSLPWEPEWNQGEQTSVFRITESEMRCWEVSGCSGCGIRSTEAQGKRLEVDPRV